MADPELSRCLHATGPIASLYLPTRGDETQAGQHITARWKILRRSLAEAGADDEVARLVRNVQANETVAQIEALRTEIGGDHRAANGPDAVITAPQMAMVDTLLVHDDPSDPRTVRIAPSGSELARRVDELVAMGIDGSSEARLIDACVRSALLDGATVRLLPASVLEDGISALLRSPAVTAS